MRRQVLRQLQPFRSQCNISCCSIRPQKLDVQVRPDRLPAGKAEWVDHEPARSDRIYVAMSGGVDSSVVAALLKQKGHNVCGIYMRNWNLSPEHEHLKQCSDEEDWDDAQEVCRHLNIPCAMIDLHREYWTQVFDPMLHQFYQGYTPNPDVSCNKYIKFGEFFERIKKAHTQTLLHKLLRMQTDVPWWVATGHYARAAVNRNTGKSALFRSKDPEKDQTFFLSQIPQEALSRTIFPLAYYTKDKVRKLAEECLPIHIASKQSSRGLCFVEPSERRFSDFLATYLSHPKTTSVYLEDGRKVGETYAIWHVTVGERSRLNFKESQKLNPGGKWYVASKRVDPPSYTIVAGKGHPKMFSGALTAKNWTWIDEEEFPKRGTVAQIRHRQTPLKCRIEDVGDGRVRVQFTHEKAWGVAQGQSVAVWYHGRCLGGGTIEFVEPGKPSLSLEKVEDYEDDE